MKKLLTLAIVGLTAACASTQENPEGLTAQAAYDMAQVAAADWAADPDLRYVWGANISEAGVPNQNGSWNFVYEADGMADNLVVQVTNRGLATTNRRETMPQGWVMDGEIENDEWIDSPDAIEALGQARLDPVLSAESMTMFLFPVNPAHWVVRVMQGSEQFEYRVNAYTGKTSVL